MCHNAAHFLSAPNVPVADCAVSPNYGQSYYEIFTLGNSGEGSAVTSLHNQPAFSKCFPWTST
ncbi:MAG: hypothetical protein R2738_01100 [Bacteroides graminisolvens]